MLPKVAVAVLTTCGGVPVFGFLPAKMCQRTRVAGRFRSQGR